MSKGGISLIEKHSDGVSSDKWTNCLRKCGGRWLASSTGSVPEERQKSSETLTAQPNMINSVSSCLYRSVYIREMSSLAVTGLFFEGWVSMNTHTQYQGGTWSLLKCTDCRTKLDCFSSLLLIIWSSVKLQFFISNPPDSSHLRWTTVGKYVFLPH